MTKKGQGLCVQTGSPAILTSPLLTYLSAYTSHWSQLPDPPGPPDLLLERVASTGRCPLPLQVLSQAYL